MARARVSRAYTVSQTNFNQRIVAQRYAEAVQREYDAGLATLDLVLAAQKQLVEAEAALAQSMAQYAVAIKTVHLEKGTLLSYDGVSLAEGPWPNKAYKDAEKRARARARLCR